MVQLIWEIIYLTQQGPVKDRRAKKAKKKENNLFLHIHVCHGIVYEELYF